MGRSQVAGDGIQLPTVFRECVDYLEENGESCFVFGAGEGGVVRDHNLDVLVSCKEANT